jgi:phosphopantothenate-cysteine ligase
VIFMHRQFSLQPFSRHYSHSTNPFLDFLDIEEPAADGETPKISVTQSKRDHLLDVLTVYKSVQKAGTLLTLNFVTVNDYLWLLRAVSQELSGLGRDAMYYLAAAVSDFFLPRQKMVSTKWIDDIPPLLNISVVRAQNSVREGEFAHRDGPGSENLKAHGRRMG